MADNSAEHTSRLETLIARALRAGADSADAIWVESRSLGVSCRNGEMEDLERSESSDIGLRVFIGKKQAIISSSDMAETTLQAIAERAVDMARHAPEDPYCGLADVADLAETFPDDLDLFDTTPTNAETLFARAEETEAAARSIDGITNSEGAGASWGQSTVALGTSHGFFGSYSTTSHGLGVSVIAGTGTGMERDYAYRSARHLADLDSPGSIGVEAGEKTVRRLNPRNQKPCKVPVIYDPRVSGSLLGHLSGAINGAAVARGTSFLKADMDSEIFADSISVVDDPHRTRGLRSKPFDAEGLATCLHRIIDHGRLTTWLMDNSSARQLGLRPTGNASRGTGSAPGAAPTNLYMEAGICSPDELIADIDNGFYVTELIGMGVNGVTGDYSRGASGFWIENGQITYPVSGLTIAGNLRDMYKNMAPASDLKFDYGINAPTVRVEGMTLAGT